ncbi:FtsK/SpoIIIE domain-containing protein [Dactylosporangium sp. NPDC000244]|uniref:FtsK/SpoIIIE domain-containing protein n=1 Tax=Dactylosporangium sp. NPDC000244 TaxID=3154365 RepID=UPI00331AE1DA
MTVTATPPAGQMPGQPGRQGAPAGTVNMSSSYYDAAGRRRRASKPVPVNDQGYINGVEWQCRKTKASKWLALTYKGAPACECCNVRMAKMPVKAPPLLPWSDLWSAINLPLRPVWALVTAGGAAVAVDAADVPALALAGTVPLAGFAAKWAAARVLAKPHYKTGRLEHEDPDGDKRLRSAIARSARGVGYTTAGGFAALAAVAALGVDPSTWAGRIAMAAVGLAWLLPAASWWRARRDERNRPVEVQAEVEAEERPQPKIDAVEADVQHRWRNKLSYRQGDQIIDDTGARITAPRDGRLAGCRLDDWHKLPGGWSGTIVGPIGVFESEKFEAARGAIASAMSMKKSMITIMPDSEDENLAQVMAQRTSPITDTVRWAGPDSIDVVKGTAPIVQYADGEYGMYEIYRPDWGVPQVAVFGTTGSGKSETLNMLFTIDRWAHYVDEHGQKHGIVANFLIDPQQGQSFAPFLDSLAAPVATTIEEATMLVEALTAEMLRRNRYLARVEYVDERGRKRRGRKWWNPLVDGPILSLTIDEAHAFLADRAFSALVTAAGRMWRKCGGQLRIATHTPLLTDLGGSMALRDMLTGGWVWVGRTANSLSGPTAFNGRLPVDPRTIPQAPGMAYVLAGADPKPMLSRAMWEPDFYDWVFDADDQPIGFPAVLPQVTLNTFGPDYAAWVSATTAEAGSWTPDVKAAPKKAAVSANAVDAVLAVLSVAQGPLDMDELDAALKGAGTPYATRTVRDALKVLRDERALVVSFKGRHELAPQGREGDAVAAEQQSLFDAETVE